MPGIQFSVSAIRDLEEIDDYTVDRWGEEQAERYLQQLRACCDRLAIHPLLGRQCSEISPGLRRFEQEKHVIFYSQPNSSVYIWRILHESMLPMMHIHKLFPEE